MANKIDAIINEYTRSCAFLVQYWNSFQLLPSTSTEWLYSALILSSVCWCTTFRILRCSLPLDDGSDELLACIFEIGDCIELYILYWCRIATSDVTLQSLLFNRWSMWYALQPDLVADCRRDRAEYCGFVMQSHNKSMTKKTSLLLAKSGKSGGLDLNRCQYQFKYDWWLNDFLLNSKTGIRKPPWFMFYLLRNEVEKVAPCITVLW